MLKSPRIDRVAGATYRVGNDPNRGGAVADVIKTCANCGNTQATGDFCEKCGTRMPAAAAPAAGAAAYSQAQTPPPSPYGAQAQPYTTPSPGYGAPQYGYVREPSPWSKLFDLSFRGFVTSKSIRTLYVIILALIGIYVVLSIVYLAMAANRFTVVNFFIALVVAALYFFWSRVLFELVASVLHLNDKSDRDA